MKRHLLLIGLPGSGKSTVGRLVAAALPASFLDIDTRLVEQTGRSIPAMFDALGEAGFRELERAEVRRALDGPPAVIVPGGGWAAQPGNLAAAVASGYAVYLETTPGTAARRVASGDHRPLLGAGDPIGRMRALLAAREPFYLAAHARVATDRRAPDEVARDVVLLARNHAGW